MAVLPVYRGHFHGRSGREASKVATQKDELLRLAGGTTFKEISKSNLKTIRVPLPPLDEQRRIVDLLNRASAIRRLAEAAQAKARDLIPALFAEMFGDPATNPKGWPVSSIGALLREKPNYGTMLKPSLEVLPWHSLRVANIQRGELSLADKKFVEPPIIKVQCKQMLGNHGRPEVAQLIGVLGQGEHGLFVTLGGYTAEARSFERSKPNLRLIDGAILVELIFAHYDKFEPRYQVLLPLKRTYVPAPVSSGG